MSSSPVDSWLELSERAYVSNVATFRSVCGPSRVGAVLKGNAYGHGLLETLSMAHGRVDALYVITTAGSGSRVGLRSRSWSWERSREGS